MANETKTGKSKAVATAAGAEAEGFTARGFIQIKIKEEIFELRGVVGGYLRVEYHEPFESALELGNFASIIGDVASALGVKDGKKFGDDLEEKIKALEGTPVAGVVAKLLNAPLKITDLLIDTRAGGTYQFGFGVDLSGAGIKVGELELHAFGMLFTYSGEA